MRLLFDLDGTLTDSFLGITNCIRHALATLEMPSPAAEDLRWCIGPPLHESFYSLLDTTNDDLVAQAMDAYRDRFGTIGLFENSVYPGIVETLELLLKEGHVLSVATSKPEIFARQIVEHFGISRYFCSVDGSGLDGTRGDKTSLISYIIERDRLDRNDVLMIGDRAHDMIGATANQIRRVGVLWGYGSQDELLESGASCCAGEPVHLASSIHRAMALPVNLNRPTGE